MLLLWRWTVYFYALGFDLPIPRWSRAEFVLTSSLLMSRFKNPSCHILFREFSSSFLRSTSLWYCTSACCKIPGAVQFREGSMIHFCNFFPLIVDSKWHLWDTLIKQFFLLLRPAGIFNRFSQSLSFFMFGWPGLPFRDPQPWRRLRQKEVS